MLLQPHDKELRLLLVVTALLLMLNLCGCATNSAPDVTPVAPRVKPTLLERCAPLPPIEPDLPDGAASESALNEDSETLESLYMDCAGRLDSLIDAVKG